MARATKRGLGRGLESLISAPQVDITPRDDLKVPERVLVSSDEVSVPVNPQTKPVKPAPVEAAPAPKQEVVPVEKKETIQAETVAQVEEKPVAEPVANKEEAIVENGAEITIKEVKERKVDEVPLLRIKPNPNQPRTNFNKEELEELAESIKKDGLLQPILVRPIGDNQYQIIAGERRWQAAQLAGLHRVPIRIREADDDEAMELALIENIQRSDLNPIEEAYGYKRIMERRSLSQSEVAQLVSKGRSTIANSLRLLELPEEAQKLLYEGTITAGHARAILSVPSLEGKKNLTHKIVEEKLSVREAEAIARLLSGKREAVKSNAPAKEPLPASFKSFARSLKKHLSTNVKVKTSGGRNRIEIEFTDEDDLKRIYELLQPEE